MFEMYYYNVPKSQHASVFKMIENQLLGLKKLDFEFYAKTFLADLIFHLKKNA